LHFTNESNTRKIEKIQERALRYIYDDFNSNYDQLLEKSGLISLKVRRLRAIALETYKILNDMSPVYLNDLLHLKHSKHNLDTPILLRYLYQELTDMVRNLTGMPLPNFGINFQIILDKLHLLTILDH
jgi:hypothetical protein